MAAPHGFATDAADPFLSFSAAPPAAANSYQQRPPPPPQAQMPQQQQQQQHSQFGYQPQPHHAYPPPPPHQPSAAAHYQPPPAPAFASFPVAGSSSFSTAAPGSLGTMSAGVGSGLLGAGGLDDEFAGEPPLLVELGVDFVHIAAKVGGVLNVRRAIDPALMSDADMAGPLVFALVLGVALLLAGKLHFGYIYGFGMVGSLAVYLLVNLMADPAHSLDVYRTVSVLGYCLLPIVLLALVAVVVDLRGRVGAALGVGSVLWCAQSATRFLEGALHMRQQRYLIAYPALLLYTVFALITIF